MKKETYKTYTVNSINRQVVFLQVPIAGPTDGPIVNTECPSIFFSSNPSTLIHHGDRSCPRILSSLPPLPLVS